MRLKSRCFCSACQAIRQERREAFVRAAQPVCTFPECDCNSENNGHHACRAPSVTKLASDRFDRGHQHPERPVGEFCSRCGTHIPPRRGEGICSATVADCPVPFAYRPG